jgi:hypothetical protein
VRCMVKPPQFHRASTGSNPPPTGMSGPSSSPAAAAPARISGPKMITSTDRPDNDLGHDVLNRQASLNAQFIYDETGLDATRLIEFGRHAAADRKQQGLSKPETFAFLGFTFICGKTRRGRFQLQRKTRRDRMQTKLQEATERYRARRPARPPSPPQPQPPNLA